MKKITNLLIAMGLTLSLITGCSSSDISSTISKAASEVTSETGSTSTFANEMEESTEEISSAASSEEHTPTEEASSETCTEKTEYTLSDLDSLENTDIFINSAIKHIFNGTINKKGQATGYHYDGIEDSDGEIVEGTKSEPDSDGIYKAQVEVNGIAKSGNRGYSSFYPEDMSPQEVIDAINEAYEDREHYTGNVYAGESDGGILIEMYLTDDDKIISAFPVYEGDSVK